MKLGERWMGAIVGAGIVAMAMSGCTLGDGGAATEQSSAPSSAPTATAAVSSPDCPNAFSAALVPDENATPGIAYLELTNTGQTACTLTGFPTVALVGPVAPGAGIQRNSDADSRGRTPVPVEPGGRAYVWLHLVELTDGDDCTAPMDVSTLSVLLPEGTQPITVDRAYTVCTDVPRQSSIDVGPVDSEPRYATHGI